MTSDSIIKTTARFQEAQEPIRQRPIIEISGSTDGQGQQVSGLIRASIDSGRDNPFRPEGVIYKSADPIVDYYKYGPNQSRTHSPTDSQLLLNRNEEDSREINQKKSKKKNSKEKKSPKRDKRVLRNQNQENIEGIRKKSCWRRWLCCCCCCCSSKCCKKKDNSDADQQAANNNGAVNGRQQVSNLTEQNGQTHFVGLGQDAEGKKSQQQSLLKKTFETKGEGNRQTTTTSTRVVTVNESLNNKQPKLNETKSSVIEFIVNEVDSSDEKSLKAPETSQIKSQKEAEQQTKAKKVNTSKCVVS